MKGDLSSGKCWRHSCKIRNTWIPRNRASEPFFGIMLIDMNHACHALCGCWKKLSKLTDQRVYQELVYQNWSIKESLTSSSSAPIPPLPFPFFFSFFRSVQFFSRPYYLRAWKRLCELWNDEEKGMTWLVELYRFLWL